MSQMTRNDEQILAAITEQAGAWFVENRSGPLNNEARASFIAWLRASPVHVQEYLGIAALAGDLAEAVNDPQLSPELLLAEARADVDNVVSLGRPLPTQATARPRLRVSRTWSLASAAVTAIVFVASAAIWSGRDGERFGLPKTYSTEHGEQSVRQLPDGSVLHLNTDTAVTVRYSRAERIVDLDRGEALFQVASDSQRRFRVAAGEAGVVAVGTEFDVYRRTGAVTVTVVEGTVAVFTGTPPLPTPSNLLPPTAIRVGAGYQVEVHSRVGSPRAVDARAAVAWLERQIAFENRPLGEVADEFNRYGRVVIEIDDGDLRAIPISGVFDAYDTDSFAAFLATLEGVVVQKTPTHIRVLRLASAKRQRLPVDQ
jgi:transmembrane sensor